jgi:hypothetical protein
MISVRAPEVLDNDTRITLKRELDECRRLACVSRFTLDAFASERFHVAPKFFTIHDNSYAQQWSGDCFVNHPWSLTYLSVAKCWEQALHCNTITMLAPSKTDQIWWFDFVEPYRDGRAQKFGRDCIVDGQGVVPPSCVRLETHFLEGRRKFGTPEDPKAVNQGSPPFWCVVLIWRRT